jgi:Porin PorA
VRLTQTLRGDVGAGTSSTSVWDQFINLYDTTNHQQIQFSQSRLAFDRNTAVLTNCCGAAIGTDTHVTFAGLGVMFPINSQKRTYNVFDTTLLKAVPAQYVGQATVDGLTANKYVETVAPTQVGTKSVPGSLVGSKASQVSLGEFYQTTTAYYVDPVTGTIVSLDQNQHVGLRDSTGTEKLALFNGDLIMTPASQQSQVNVAKSGDTESSAVKTIVPLTAGLLGVVLLVFGIVLVLMSRNDEEEYAEE